ncbi:extracellular solute-binding protein [Bifidobacterium sp. 82T10]|uniref:Extracellular solute-binding protein n=2 Tax=Bifidobacterium miconis TaxID=2834435 RepID=A0ABS6WCZ4_9BIFI|nr:extracellular solute-binding protein [Bifidobacterium miconis]MBW3091921.1 extracellular solute-binding protein [Bifidobacterium miconis]
MNKRTMLKTAAAVSSVAMLAAVGACGNSDAGATKDGKPAVSVLVVMPDNRLPFKTMQWAKDVEKDCGCAITWKTVSNAAWNNQKNVTLASGEIPDLTIRGFFKSDTANNASMFENLADDLDKMPNVKKYLETKQDAKNMSSTIDGEIFSLVSDRGSAYHASGQHMMINKTWLDKLGLKMPTTWDELENVLEAFKTQDPNGNGKADEIPMQIRKLNTTGFGWYDPFLLLNSTGIVTHFNGGPSTTGIYAKDGKVASFLISDEFKSVISYYHELISKGLVPTESLTMDDSTYTANLQGDGKTAKVGVAFGWDIPTTFGDGLADQYVAMPAPAAPGVSQDEVVWDGSQVENEFVNSTTVSSAAKNKDAVFKLLNLLFSEKYSVQQFKGDLSKWVEKTGDHEYTVSDKYYQQSPSEIPALEDGLSGWIPDDVTIKGDKNADRLQEVDQVYAEQYQHFDPTKDIIPEYVNPSSDDNITLSNNNTAMFDYAMPKIGGWMRDGGIDNDWADYVASMKKFGLDQNVQIWQKWYDQYTK